MSEYDPAESTDLPATAPAVSPGPLEEHHRLRHEADAEFSAFYRKTIRSLVAFLINQGAAIHVAADIAQDTMTTAYRRWGDLRTPKAWAYKAASRAMIRKIAAVEEDPVGDVPEPTSLLARPDAIAEWEARHDMLPLLRSLPPRQRQVLAWTMAGFTPGDIADELGLPADTVRANLMKARRAAVAYLGTREEEQ
ncbi:RNA polymerase sigma factor [Streptomyces yunnanensis]|uniref:RNA polymerase sigma factor, sigma-70 family n=1 Tax=Streptomyces yunnanensis TaxID=156453 RepID=A0A9X8N573_9ACTN|nr:sigma-70 family RNA polymerase sigma factor [Streptomyces yunnanensis]SHN03666.1 RNA polymerase sigma factor, sigma-70 family [Streptomyces yunnanensis]